MSKIYKYEIPLEGAKIEMPVGTKILTVQLQRGAICLWAIVGPTAVITEDRMFVIYGTGFEVEGSKPIKYIGTVQSDDGSYVWHVFEIKRYHE